MRGILARLLKRSCHSTKQPQTHILDGEFTRAESEDVPYNQTSLLIRHKPIILTGYITLYCVGFSATCHINFSQPSLYHWILDLYHHHVRANILEFPTLYLSYIWRPLPSWPSHVDIRSQSRKTLGTCSGKTIEFSIHRLSDFSYPWSMFSSSWLLASSSCIYSWREPSPFVFPLELQSWNPMHLTCFPGAYLTVLYIESLRPS